MAKEISTAEVWAHGLSVAIGAAILAALFATSDWWVLLGVLAVGATVPAVWLLQRLVGPSQRVLMALLALLGPLAFFLLTGALAWSMGIPQGIKAWIHAGGPLLESIGSVVLYIGVYGFALLFPVGGAVAATYYAVQEGRLNEYWIVSMICIWLGLLSGGVCHLMYAGGVQL